MKKLLIISPNFPPINTADVHRIRQSLPYYEALGWIPYVACVDPIYIEHPAEELLLESIPPSIKIIKVSALSVKLTRKVGLGNLALRSMYFFIKEINRFLKETKIDLIFFSTTQFQITVLGNYWKRKFSIPYVIDMQDPWYTNNYLSKPKKERPPKFILAQVLHYLMEPIAMKHVDAIIAVSNDYSNTLCARYPWITPSMCFTIPFGAFEADTDIANKVSPFLTAKAPNEIRVVYVGRGGYDMQKALKYIFSAYKLGLSKDEALFESLTFYFIGTSYAPKGSGISTIQPIADDFGLNDRVHETTDRIPYFQAIRELKEADMLIVPGSDDPAYTASKIYPYILVKKPILAVFHYRSSVVAVINKTKAGIVHTFDNDTKEENISRDIYLSWKAMLKNGLPPPQTDWSEFFQYTAEEATKKQVEVFNKVLESSCK